MIPLRPRHELGSRTPWLHEGGVGALGFAADGSVLSASDREARTWVLATGEISRRTERGPRGGATVGSAFLPHLRRWIAFVGIGEGFAFRSWDLGTGALLDEVEIERGTHLLALAHDRAGKRALVRDREPDPPTTHLVSIETGRILATFEALADAGAFLAGGEILLATSGHAIEIRDADGSNPRVLVEPRTTASWGEERVDEVSGIETCRDAAAFLVSYESGVRRYGADGSLECEVPEHGMPFAITPDGERFATRASGRIVVHDRSGRELRTMATGNMNVALVALHDDGRFAAFASPEGAITVHALTDESRRALPGRPPPRDGDFVLPGAVSALSAAPEAPQILVICVDGELFLWNVPDSAPVPVPGFGSVGFTVDAFFAPDGSAIAIGGGLLRRTDVRTGALLLECAVPPLGCTWNASGTLIALPSEGRMLWIDCENGELVRDAILEPIPGIEEEHGFGSYSFRSAALSPSGRLALATLHGVGIWNPDGTALRAVLPDGSGSDPVALPVPPTFLSDDRLLLGAVVSPARILDLATGTMTPLAADGPRTVTAFSRDRRRCAYRPSLESSANAGLAVWDLQAGKRIQECPARDFEQVAFLANGSLVTTSADRRIRIWGEN